jgi:hypothetical protein
MARRAKSVPPLGPLTVAMTVREGGVGELVLLAAAKPMLAGVTMNCWPAVLAFGGGVSPPPPWQPATKHATSAATPASASVDIPAVPRFRAMFAEEYIDGSRRQMGCDPVLALTD